MQVPWLDCTLTWFQLHHTFLHIVTLWIYKAGDFLVTILT